MRFEEDDRVSMISGERQWKLLDILDKIATKRGQEMPIFLFKFRAYDLDLPPEKIDILNYNSVNNNKYYDMQTKLKDLGNLELQLIEKVFADLPESYQRKKIFTPRVEKTKFYSLINDMEMITRHDTIIVSANKKEEEIAKHKNEYEFLFNQISASKYQVDIYIYIYIVGISCGKN